MRFFYRLLIAWLLLLPITGWAIDLQPDDIVAPFPDKNYLMLSYLGTQNSVAYKNGSALSSLQYSNPVIDNSNAILRLVRTYSLEGMPAVSYVQLPYGNVIPSGSLSNLPDRAGFGDLTLTTAIWPYANRDTRTYLALAGYLSIPTGNYASSLPFNISENRYKWDIQLGFQAPIVENLSAMVAVDTVWYGTNNQCAASCQLARNVSLDQAPLTTLQFGPVYKINQIFTVGASYFFISGGGSSINGIDQNNAVNTQKFLLSSLIHTHIGRFSLQYGRDMSVTNGFFQNRVVALRYATEF